MVLVEDAEFRVIDWVFTSKALILKNVLTLSEGKSRYRGSDPTDSEIEFKTPKAQRKRKKIKGRYPSGNFLSNTVEDIRNFFTQDSGDETRSPPNRKSQPSNKLTTIAGASDHPTNSQLKHSRAQVNQAEQSSPAQSSPVAHSHNTNMQGVNDYGEDQLVSPQHSLSQVLNAIKKQTVQSQQKHESVGKCFQEVMTALQKRDAIIKEVQEKETPNISTSNTVEATPEIQSQAMDIDQAAGMNVKLVLEMFRDLKAEIQKDRITAGSERVKILEEVQQFNVMKVQDINEELEERKEAKQGLN